MILNTKKPFERMGGKKIDADFIRQNGVVFAWSESNVRYERAWWLYPDAPRGALTNNLRKNRPLPEGEKL